MNLKTLETLHWGLGGTFNRIINICKQLTELSELAIGFMDDKITPGKLL